MVGLGTIINCAGIILGGLIGLVVGKKIKASFGEMIMKALGLCVIFIGAGGVISKMCTVTSAGQLKTDGEFLMILSLVLGAIVGESLDLEGKTERFGEWLKKKTKSTSDTLFIDGFVSASVTVCVGAMAIMGALEDGLFGRYTILITKTMLDTVMVMVMTSSHGKGCIFSAIPCAVLQGGVTVLAGVIEPFVTDAVTNNLSLVGNVLIFGIGINLTFGKKIKVANLLPAIVFAVCFTFVPFLN